MRLDIFKRKPGYIAGFIILIFFITYPLLVDSERSYLVYFLYTTFIYIILAQGWNLVAGYTGQVSLGQHAFFGLGAYITAITWRAGITGYLDPLAFLMSGFGAMLLAIVVGLFIPLTVDPPGLHKPVAQLKDYILSITLKALLQDGLLDMKVQL